MSNISHIFTFSFPLVHDFVLTFLCPHYTSNMYSPVIYIQVHFYLWYVTTWYHKWLLSKHIKTHVTITYLMDKYPESDTFIIVVGVLNLIYVWHLFVFALIKTSYLFLSLKYVFFLNESHVFLFKQKCYRLVQGDEISSLCPSVSNNYRLTNTTDYKCILIW